MGVSPVAMAFSSAGWRHKHKSFLKQIIVVTIIVTTINLGAGQITGVSRAIMGGTDERGAA